MTHKDNNPSQEQGQQTELVRYVGQRVQSGARKAAIYEELTTLGWSEDAVGKAYASGLRHAGAPVPDGSANTRTAYASPLEIMLNFFSFLLLAVLATALGRLYFEIIDWLFPDSAVAGGMGSFVSAASVHYATATLMIGIPLYFFVLRMWFRAFRGDTRKTESRITKWLTYFVLLVSSVTIVGDLIATLFTFLQGEMGIRFFAKACVVLFIAGMIFGFYFLERKKVQYGRAIAPRTFASFGWAMLGVVALGIVLGFFATGSPHTERLRALDQKRAEDLSMLAVCVNRYAKEFNRLPETLADLADSQITAYCAHTADPHTQEPYAYSVVTSSETQNTTTEGVYELCAVFDTDTQSSDRRSPRRAMGGEEKWFMHSAGYDCDVERVTLEDRAE